MKKIKKVSDLPEWYSLDKYQDAKILDSFGWYSQIQVRSFLKAVMENSPNSVDAITAAYDEAVKYIREKPIIDVSSSRLLKEIVLGHLVAEGQVDINPAVHTLTIRELYEIEHHVREYRGECPSRYYRKYFRGEIPDGDDSCMYEKWIDEPVINSYINSSFVVPTVVDLSLPDKAIVDSFERYLSVVRSQSEERPSKAPSKKIAFSNWIKFGVLPYLDLNLWCNEVDTEITNRVMADAIFPSYERGEESVRKTTSKLSEDILSLEVYLHLKTRISYEKAEQNIELNLPEK